MRMCSGGSGACGNQETSAATSNFRPARLLSLTKLLSTARRVLCSSREDREMTLLQGFIFFEWMIASKYFVTSSASRSGSSTRNVEDEVGGSENAVPLTDVCNSATMS